MKKLFFPIFLFLCFSSNAQLAGKISYYCSYYGQQAKLTELEICLRERSLPGLYVHDRATKILEDITGEIGLPLNFLLVECMGIENCMAVNLQAKKGFLRYIIYDNEFLKSLDSTTSNSYWTSVSIFAHEIGHHLSGHTLDSMGSRPDKELEADRFSGFIMYKLGATLEQAQAAMKEIGAVRIVSTHPPLPNRLAAIRNGWNDGWSSNYRQKSNQNTMPVLKPLEDIATELYDKAYLENILGNYEEAVKNCNTAIHLKKNYAEAYCLRGLAQGNMLKTDDAIKSLDTAIQINPDYLLPKIYKGRAYSKAKMYDKAERAFLFADLNDIGIRSGELRAEWAQLFLDQKKYDAAIKAADKAIDLGYKDVHIPLGIIGYSYLQQKKYYNSVLYFLDALEANPLYEFARKYGMEAAKKHDAEVQKVKKPVAQPKKTTK
jgi:tetratricopeptide (TPR) repeat protein